MTLEAPAHVVSLNQLTAVTRVALYIRISTDEEHQPYSLDAQRQRLSAYVGSQPGWTATGPAYCDEKSGATADRPALQQALAAAKAGEFDVLLVYRVDRLARSLRTLVTVLDDLATAGVGLRSVTEPIDTSSAIGRMLIQMLGVFAQFEREIIIDRVICGMERKAAAGLWTGGTRPYGYLLDRHSGTLVPDPEEALIVRQIFAAYADTSRGVRATAAHLNASGLRNRSGRPWSGNTISRLLANRAYLGEKVFRDVTTPRAHPPLVERTIFDRVQQTLSLRAEKQPAPAANTSNYLLSGVITCATCNARYVGTAANGRHRRYRYYTCQTRSRLGPSGCTGPRLRADHLEELILQTLVARYRHTDLLKDAVALAPDACHASTATLRAELAHLTRQIATTSGKIDRYMKAFEDDTRPTELCRTRLNNLVDQTAELKARCREIRQDLRLQLPAPNEAELNRLPQQFAGALAAADTSQLKSLVAFSSLKSAFTAASRSCRTSAQPVE